MRRARTLLALKVKITRANHSMEIIFLYLKINKNPFVLVAVWCKLARVDCSFNISTLKKGQSFLQTRAFPIFSFQRKHLDKQHLVKKIVS